MRPRLDLDRSSRTLFDRLFESLRFYISWTRDRDESTKRISECVFWGYLLVKPKNLESSSSELISVSSASAFKYSKSLDYKYDVILSSSTRRDSTTVS